MFTDEIWVDVNGYEGLYQVSDFGNVKSLNFKRSGVEGLLSLGPDSKGYLRVNLSKNGQRKIFWVHQMVAVAFLGHIVSGYTVIVDHKDNDKLNNRKGNLQLVTPRLNTSKDKKNKTP